MTRRVLGVGVNDFGSVKLIVNGKRSKIPSYIKWSSMLSRCYSLKYQNKYPSYKNCTVCDEWLLFSGFKDWYDKQYKEDGWELDKDLLSPGNKVYTPEKCILVPRSINLFVTDHKAAKGRYLIGCSWKEANKKFSSHCNNPFTKKMEYLGLHEDEHSAHQAWKARKHEIACEIAKTVHDERLAEALKKRYL